MGSDNVDTARTDGRTSDSLYKLVIWEEMTQNVSSLICYADLT